MASLSLILPRGKGNGLDDLRGSQPSLQFRAFHALKGVEGFSSGLCNLSLHPRILATCCTGQGNTIPSGSWQLSNTTSLSLQWDIPSDMKIPPLKPSQTYPFLYGAGTLFPVLPSKQINPRKAVSVEHWKVGWGQPRLWRLLKPSHTCWADVCPVPRASSRDITRSLLSLSPTHLARRHLPGQVFTAPQRRLPSHVLKVGDAGGFCDELPLVCPTWNRIGKDRPSLSVNQSNFIKSMGLQQFGCEDSPSLDSTLAPRVRLWSFCLTALIRQGCKGRVMAGEELNLSLISFLWGPGAGWGWTEIPIR